MIKFLGRNIKLRPKDPYGFRMKSSLTESALFKRLVLERAKCRCERCGREPKQSEYNKFGNNGHGLQGHHIMPKICGGLSSEGNILIVCYKCHDKLHGRIGYKRLAKC